VNKSHERRDVVLETFINAKRTHLVCNERGFSSKTLK
jgi:hypothetical protein